MFNIHVKPSRELRNNYAQFSSILKDHDQIIITNKGKGEAVLISIEDYADYEEYVHRRYVREKLSEAEAAATKPDAVWLNHEEFWDDLV
ncbi:type II toxin-antitoxin system Phd/YefM family antitoxin [Treponema primitia]|uniref:type II toxin-antitoxin system Phd/YefM family antitoxin n=1 Tax=Treponema primitia TaxID=88058 RepID=UPI00397E9397